MVRPWTSAMVVLWTMWWSMQRARAGLGVEGCKLHPPTIVRAISNSNRLMYAHSSSSFRCPSFLSAYTGNISSTTTINGVNFQGNVADFGPDIFSESGAELSLLSVVNCSSLGIRGPGLLPPCQTFTCDTCPKKLCSGESPMPTTPLPSVPQGDPFTPTKNSSSCGFGL